jgi:Na+-translocating ferredoxin:NAD+ oxidoreductase RnfG subunit
MSKSYGDELLDLLREVLQVVQPKEEDFNHVLFKEETEEQGRKLSSIADNTKLIFDGTNQVRVFGLVATVTEILYGKRLAWCIDQKTGRIVDVCWYTCSNTLNGPKLILDHDETPSCGGSLNTCSE